MSTKRRVAIQGIAGSFHEIAAKAYFEEDEVEIIPCHTFKEVFNELRKDGNVIALVAIENTVAGSLLPNYNLLRESNAQVMGEYKLRITHNLCAMPGQKLEDITEVLSHPMAFMQCENFLEEHVHMKNVKSEDTAGSAKIIQDTKALGRAAICSELAAKTYGLEILATSIETNKRNFTRFLVIGDPWSDAHAQEKRNESNKSSIVFALPHEEGSLSKILTILSFYNINLTKIQSLPIVGQIWEYLFYVDLSYDNYVRYQQSLEAIKPLTRNLKILGDYKKGKQSFDDTASE